MSMSRQLENAMVEQVELMPVVTVIYVSGSDLFKAKHGK